MTQISMPTAATYRVEKGTLAHVSSVNTAISVDAVVRLILHNFNLSEICPDNQENIDFDVKGTGEI